MSGIELIGLAASVLQIADLGWKVSYKLYAFSTKVHEASKTIELISQDISATGAILKQLGDTVKEDEEAKPASRLCSQALIDAASRLVEECRDLFKGIDLGIGSSGKDGNKIILGFRQKLKWSYLEPRVELLRTNLERLKSSLAVMLNVLIYAEQRRTRVENAIIAEQQTLVARLATRKANAEKKIELLKKTIENEPTQGMVQATTILGQGDASNDAPSDTSTSATMPSSQLQRVLTFQVPTPKDSPRPNIKYTHLEYHCQLIEKLLEEVNSSRYALDHGVRYRLENGVLDLHWLEWSPLRLELGDEVLRGFLVHSPMLARHWHGRVDRVVAGLNKRQCSNSPGDGGSRSPERTPGASHIAAAALESGAITGAQEERKSGSQEAAATGEHGSSACPLRSRSMSSERSPNESTSTFTAVLRISQAVYELKAVGEQTRDLLDSTKYVNSTLESVRELRHKKSALLNREEKQWIDQQVQFTQKAVDGVAVLIERARVDVQAKNEIGNEDDYETKHIKIHHRARFVLRDGPKVLTNLAWVSVAMNGLNSAMVTLSSLHGHGNHLAPAECGNTPGRRSISPGKALPPYMESDFLNRRRSKAGSTKCGHSMTLDAFGSQTVPDQALNSQASISSITPSINFASARGEHFYGNAISDDTTSPACLPTSSIRDSINREAYFDPADMDVSAYSSLHFQRSEPAVSQQVPRIPRKPLAYQTHQPNTSSITSHSDEFGKTISSSARASSTPHAPHPSNWQPFDAQSSDSVFHLNFTPSASVISPNSTGSDLGCNHPAIAPSRRQSRDLCEAQNPAPASVADSLLAQWTTVSVR